MSDTQDPLDSPEPTQSSSLPEEPPPYVIPVRYLNPGGPRPVLQPPAPPPRSALLGRILLLLVLAGSIGFNVLLLALLGQQITTSDNMVEHTYSGKENSREKVAVVKLDGVIMEGTSAYNFFQSQIDQAAADSSVKAVLVRINSPGGTITGSDDLHRRLIELREGKNPHQKGAAKTVVVSMGALAASGGYYIAMPAEYVMAETTTITGSIGVYAAFPNVSGLAKEWGIGMNVIKAGEVKDSGSMFKQMTPEERQLWQDMVDTAFDRFLKVVEEGRPALKGKLREVVVSKPIPVLDDAGKPKLDDKGKKETVLYTRRRADGGIWTAEKAKELGLVDGIGYLRDAIQETAKRAQEKGQLSGSAYKVVTYERPPGVLQALGVLQAPQSSQPLDANKLAAGAIPRLWFLAPQSELAGVFAAMGKE